VQGAMIGWLGVLIGIALGIVLAIFLPDIVPVVERLFGFQILPADVYYNSRIPSELQWAQVGTISVAAFVLTSLATLYPSRRAALVDPAAALRYE
ncbi:MAG: lipoprotein-releasing system transmembrane subunit LolC, partial [Woeseiaceae bacterium]